MLDPDEVLSRYENWKDSSHPVSSTQKELMKRKNSKQADPFQKDGIIGTFCSIKTTMRSSYLRSKTAISLKKS